MYKSPPPVNQDHEKQLRQTIIQYELLGGFMNGYGLFGLEHTIGLLRLGRGVLLLGLLIFIILIMYLPFLRTRAMSIFEWTRHVKQLTFGVGVGVLLSLTWFISQGVGFPSWLGLIIIGLCMFVSLNSALQFLKSRLEEQW